MTGKEYGELAKRAIADLQIWTDGYNCGSILPSKVIDELKRIATLVDWSLNPPEDETEEDLGKEDFGDLCKRCEYSRAAHDREDGGCTLTPSCECQEFVEVAV